MSKSNRRNKSIKIKNVQPNVSIDRDVLSHDDYPTFCFKYLSSVSIRDCKSPEFFVEFLLRLKKLSELGWKEIRQSHKHSFGMEKIPVEKIRPQLPVCVTPDVKHLHVLRATGSNLPFVGVEMQKVFRVLFIETAFGDIYDH